MTHTVSNPGLGNEFDAFLFAPIGEERNGMLLSVLSALARLDLDPWQEAANLARLPKESATQRLTSLLDALPDGVLPGRDRGTIAARLIGLLARPAGRNGQPSPLPGASAAIQPSAVLMWAVLLMFFLSAQWISSSQNPPAPGADPSAPVSGVVSPNTPPQP